ncbi:MAG TPA: hypothetical protein VD970_06180, partial [Acetobacteraceae bacterium]|nr:hypothetical protein [Acetobacteraceae bacterium]
MRFFLNLSVGRKLAAGVALALILIGALVLEIQRAGGRIAEEQAALSRIEETQARLRRAIIAFGAAPLHLGDMVAANSSEAVATRAREGQAVLDHALDRLRAAQETLRAPELQPALRSLEEPFDSYGTALAAASRLRLHLIEQRDTHFFARGTQYDQSFESVMSGIEHDLSGAAQEDTRQRFLVFHQAVNDLRLALQRYMATGEEGQANRVRRAIAQANVHLRGAINAADAPRVREELERSGQQATALGEAALAILEAAQRIARLRAEQLTPSRLEAERRFAEAARLLDVAAEAGRTRTAAATAAAQERTLWLGIAVALLLGLVGLLNARTVGLPLRRLARSVAAIAEGRTDTAIADCNRLDE